MLEITSSSNPLIKEVKGLYRKKNRWNSRSYIIEGRKIIDEAISQRVKVKNIICSEDFFLDEKNQEILKKYSSFNNAVKTSNQLFKEISDTENSQGVLAVVEFNHREIENIKQLDRPSLLFLDELQDPGNMGTIIRTGDAFNIDGIILGEGCVDPYNPKVVRSTMGSIFRTPVYICNQNSDCLLMLKKLGLSIFASSLDGELLPNKSFNKGFVCIIGNESRGVDYKIMEMADQTIKIPMPGNAESLNAGVAASIIMYEIMKSRL